MDASTFCPLYIAVVTETYPPEINGVARTIGAMVEQLHARGNHIQLTRPRQHRDDRAEDKPRFTTVLCKGVPIPKYPELRMGLPCTGALINAWRRRRPDIVHVVTEGPLGASALKAARKLGIPCVSEFRTNFDTYSGHYGLGLFKPVVTAYLRRFHNRTDRTLVPTSQLQAELRENGYRNLRVVGRGVDLQTFNPGRRSAALRASWGATDDDTVLIYVGRLAPEKNFRLFVEAARTLQSSFSALRVVVVGDGPQRKALEAANADFVFAGQRRGIDLAEHYASADIFLFPSRSETFGNVTTEAMASGLAVLGFDYAAARQYIRHGENGLLAPFGDDAQFVHLARRLVAGPAFREALREGAIRTASTFGWPRVADEMETLFYELSDKPRRASAPPQEQRPCDAQGFRIERSESVL